MATATIEQQLAHHRFFKGLDKSDIAFIASHGRQRRIAANEILFRNDERANAFYLLQRGSLTIEIPAISGPTLDVQTLEAKAVIGWSWLISSNTWSFQGRAEEPSELLEFDGPAILKRCEQDPKFGYELFKRFSLLMYERLESARHRMIDEWNPPGFA